MKLKLSQLERQLKEIDSALKSIDFHRNSSIFESFDDEEYNSCGKCGKACCDYSSRSIIKDVLVEDKIRPINEIKLKEGDILKVNEKPYKVSEKGGLSPIVELVTGKK